MVSDLWAGELFSTPRLPSASGEGTSTAKLLTFERAERGGNRGMCFFEGESAWGRFS